MDHFLGHCLAGVSGAPIDKQPTDPSSPAFLGFGSVALASALIVVNALVSVVLHLDLAGQLLVAALRQAFQVGMTLRLLVCLKCSLSLCHGKKTLRWGYRCVLQLLALGYILGPIFSYNTWWLVLGYSCIMLLVGNYEACSRPAYSYTVSPSCNISCMPILHKLSAIYIWQC